MPDTEYENGRKLDVFDCGFLFYCFIIGRKPAVGKH